ncbi:MAG: glycerate kinase [Candidatus Nanopelagicales bacterium]
MRVVVAPDKFAGTLSADEAARAIAAGWHRTAPDDEVDLVPLSDGGPGFVEVLHTALGGEWAEVFVTGPLGEPVPARVLLVPGDGGPTGYVESAQACGLHLLAPDRRDPTRTTTYGVGELVAAVVDAGARRVVVGLGGSGTNDGGAGMLAALGATARSGDGADATALLARGGRALREVASVDLGPARERLRGVGLVAATDVDVPLLGLRGAANGFARQKGADDAAVMALEGALEGWARAVGRTADGKDPAVALGAGAAGGLGYALLALGATRVPGAETVLRTVRLAERVAVADLLVTGEGAFDWQSLRGKVVAGAAAAALASARPVVVLAGRVEVGRREYVAIGVTSAYGVVDPEEPEAAGPDPSADHAARLADLAARVARSWSA